MEDLQPRGRAPKRAGLVVLGAGVTTSLLTLALVFVLSVAFDGFHAMGWYLNGVIPFGAILVGLVAGSGYGIASWLTGAKINRGLLLMVILLQVGAYFLVQYVEYLMIRAANPEALTISFWQYFDAVTRAFCWEEEGGPGEPFGAWGYGMRALEIAGFALGGIVAPAILFAVPYCEKCQVYIRSRDLGLLPAGVTPKKIKKKDWIAQEQYEQEVREALDRGRELVEQAVQMVAAVRADQFAALLAEHAQRKKEIGNSTSRIAVKLQHCRRCGSGIVIFQRVTGQGENVSATEIGRCPAEPEFVRALEMELQ